MLSIQFITRNLRRVASLRGFSSATMSEKSEITEKLKKSTTQSPKSKALFAKLKSLNDPNAVDETAEFASTKSMGAEKMDSETSTTNTNTTTKTTKTALQSQLATRIANATTVNDLLQLSEKGLNQQNAMSILTKLSVWTASNKANVKTFESDYRFLKLCRILSKAPMTNNIQNIIHKEQQKSAELEMVLSIAGDDEASKIIESLPLSQKVRVFSSLARKKSRSIPVLKTLASTISAHPSKMDLKECSDLLYAMATLNFVDEMLLSRISIDINDKLDKNQDKTAVVGSIVTSIGFLKYKEPILLDNLIKWIIDKQELCRPKDLSSLILTLALVNHRSKYVNDTKTEILPKISQDDLSCNEWLDFVWALSVLELHQPKHLETVLRPEFFERLIAEQGTDDMLPAQKMKLLNINAVATHFTANYNGPFLKPDTSVYECPLGYRKSKKVLIEGLLDTLKNLFTNNSHIRIEHDSKLGFIIDVECLLNESRVPLAVESENKDAFRVAMLVLDYHDMCKGQTKDPNGFNALAIKLLQKTGYNVLEIPHNEFSTSDKVLKRVQYLDSKLKNIVNQSKQQT